MKIYLIVNIILYGISWATSLFNIIINKERNKSLAALLLSTAFMFWAVSLYIGTK